MGIDMQYIYITTSGYFLKRSVLFIYLFIFLMEIGKGVYQKGWYTGIPVPKKFSKNS